jgi:Predicted oxidoreductases (related to aryl-alcohol dehydrogenases)
VHAYDPLTPLEETLRTLDQFIRAGKIRYYGLSNFTGWQLTKAWLARVMNVAEPVTLQPQYSLLAREIEWEIVPAASTRAWGCCRGARSAGAGCPASTGGTSARPGTPGSATTRTAAWRPTTGAAPSAPGTSSTRCRR